MKYKIVLIIFVLLFVSGCFSPKITNNKIQIISQKGVGTGWSNGLDILSDEIKEQYPDTNVSVGSFVYWKSISKQIANIHPDHIILIGHSSGADASILISRELNKHNINVDILVLLDPTFPKPIPSNVKYCIVLRPRMSEEIIELKKNENNDTTKFFYKNLKLLNHFSIDDSEWVHVFVKMQINEYMEQKNSSAIQ